MYDYLILFVAVLIFLIGGFIAFYFGKKKGKPSITNLLDQTVDKIEKFEQLLNDGESVKKDFIQNLNKKGVVRKRKELDTVFGDKSEFDFDNFIGDSEKADKFKEEFESTQIILRVDKDLNESFFSRFKRTDYHYFIVPEKLVFETDEKIIIDKDVDFYPAESNLWIPNFLSSISIFQSVSFLDLWNIQLDMLKENMKHVQHFNIAHSQEIEKIKEGKLNLERNNGHAGDTNKYIND